MKKIQNQTQNQIHILNWTVNVNTSFTSNIMGIFYLTSNIWLIFLKNMIYISTDNGNTFTLKTTFSGFQILNFLLFCKKSNTNYLLLKDVNNRGVPMYSSDLINWTASTITLNDTVGNQYTWANCCYLNNGNILLIAAKGRKVNGSTYNGGPVATAISTDNGQNFVIYENALPGYSDPSTTTLSLCYWVNYNNNNICYGNGIYVIIPYCYELTNTNPKSMSMCRI